MGVCVCIYIPIGSIELDKMLTECRMGKVPIFCFCVSNRGNDNHRRLALRLINGMVFA